MLPRFDKSTVKRLRSSRSRFQNKSDTGPIDRKLRIFVQNAPSEFRPIQNCIIELYHNVTILKHMIKVQCSTRFQEKWKKQCFGKT